METQATNLPVTEEVTPKASELEEPQTPVAEPVIEATSEREPASAEIIVSEPEAEAEAEMETETETTAESCQQEEQEVSSSALSDEDLASSVPESSEQKAKEQQLPEEPEESPKPVPIPEIAKESTHTEEQPTEQHQDEAPPSRPALSKTEIVSRLQLISNEPENYSRSENEALKKAYFRIRNAEIEEKKKEHVANGGLEETFTPPDEELDVTVRALVNDFRNKKSKLEAEEERRKESNLILKQHLIEQMKALTESQEGDFNKRYNEFRELQRKWKLIKSVPHEHQRELGRNYLLYSERFYDLVKINNQFREYDYKKNYEAKTALCEKAERLAVEKDVIVAFKQLQKLHEQWREIGPVAREHRVAIWERFKAASAIVNHRHQSRSEEIRNKEEANYIEKKAICEAIESIDTDALKTMSDWDKQTTVISELQEKWRTLGFASKKYNDSIFKRFRVACDKYFAKRTAFFKQCRLELEKNLELKKALVEKAEELKESNDWKETSKKLTALQAEWRTIGSVPRRHSEQIWERFNAACDYFYERKSRGTSTHRSEELDNLDSKRAIIQKIKGIDINLDAETALSQLREHIAEWNKVGYVPYKDKEQLHKDFRTAVDEQFNRLKVHERDRRLEQFRSNINELSGENKNKKLYNERDKLVRVYERMKSELATYENNIGFFTVSSKGGDGLKKEIERKLIVLKEDMQVILKKIETIDENLD